ncbi:MAG: DUF3618 domain-containing protein [Geobacter sp.]|nr:MAG: DUF3618 domain-containing protein [Geobacter sp.]
MGENVKVHEQHASADEIREQIRHTEGDITRTVHDLEERLSPHQLRARGVRRAKLLAWKGIAGVLRLAQRTSVQASLLGASAALMALGNKRVRDRVTAGVGMKKTVEVPVTGGAARAAGAGALWLLLRRLNAGRSAAVAAPVSGWSLAATALKSFLSGKRASQKHGTPREGKKLAWRGLAASVGAALGSYWYNHKAGRV